MTPEMVERVAKAIYEWTEKGLHAPSWDEGGFEKDYYRDQAYAAIEVMREPTDEMEDAARGAWLWYSGLPHDNKWTLGQQNKAGGYKLSLTDEEAAATHLPKHVMGRICWRTQIDKALGK